MTSVELLSVYLEVFKTMGELENHIVKMNLISKELDEEQNKIISLFLKNSFSSSLINVTLNEAGEKIKSKMDLFIKNFNFMDAHKTVLDCKTSVENIIKNYDCKLFKGLVNDLFTEFEGTLSELMIFITNRNVETIPKFNEKCRNFLLKYNQFRSSFDVIEESHLTTYARYEGTNQKNTFIIQFYDEKMTFKDFIIKLHAIHAFYQQICKTADVNYDDYPLQIIKIESGSAFLKLFGAEKISEGMMIIFNIFVKNVFKKYTKEGKMETLDQTLDLVLKTAEVKKKLDELGINTNTSDKEIAESFNTVSKALNILVNGQNKIRVNDNLHEIINPVEISLHNNPLTNNINNQDLIE